ncbi:ISAs1 family transposase [Verrucomicrobiota bacterium]
MDLPEECRSGAQSDADGVLPLKKKQSESLFEALCKVPDPRASNRTFHIGAILTIVAMAIFSGHRNMVQIVRFAKRLRNDQRKELGLPLFKKGSSYRKVPSYKVFYNLLRKIDIDAFAENLSQWLAQHSGTLPKALALDGKFIRDTVGIVCLVDHETGAPRAMAKASQKEGEGEDCEMKAAQRMIRREPDLSNAVVTADALHAQRETARDIVAQGGEFIIQAKDNQKTAHKAAKDLTAGIAPFLPVRRKHTAG